MATKKQRVWNTPYNYDYTKYHEDKMPPSETRPDMALTIPEIMKRYASGRAVNVPIFDDYGGEDDHLTGVDVRTLDLSEINDMVEHSRSNIEKLKFEAQRRRKEKEDQELEKSIIEKFKKRQEAEKPADQKPVYVQTSILDKKQDDQS